jgi:exodeoxyribonuclease VII large subunit
MLEAERRRFAALARSLPRRADILALPRQRFDAVSSRLPRALLANAVAHRAALERCASRLRPHLVTRAVLAGRERLSRLDRSRQRSLRALLDRRSQRLSAQGKLLETLGYHNVLARGFTLVRAADGTMLRRADEVKPGAALDIEFADGHVGAHADPREQRAPAPKARRRSFDENQGNLL